MARLIVESDDGRTRIEVREDADTAWTSGWCEEHQIELTDHGHFADTTEVIAAHIDIHH